MHGGKAPAVAAKALERDLRARQEALVNKLGLTVETTPADAILECIAYAAGELEYYRGLVQTLHPGFTHADEHGRVVYGIVNPTFHGSGRVTGDGQPHPYVRLYHEASDRLFHVCATALKLGVEEHRVRLRAAQVQVLRNAFLESLTAVGLSDQQIEKASAIFAEHLRRQIAYGEAA